MSGEARRWIANLSILFTELPVRARPQAAKAAGFDAVEFWWPFAEAVPGAAEVDAFVRSLDDAGVSLAAMNFFAGDMSAGDRGVVSVPSRQSEFRASVPVLVEVAARTGARVFNALYGQRMPGLSPAEQDATAVEALSHAAAAVAAVGGTVVIEALTATENGNYPLLDARDCATVLDRIRRDDGPDNLGILFDTYHLTSNGADLVDTVLRYSDRIRHVQLADAPGRGQPGSGTVDFAAVISALQKVGYRGDLSCEYRPTGPTGKSLGWLQQDWARAVVR